MAVNEETHTLTDEEAAALSLDTNFVWTRITYSGDIEAESLNGAPKPNTPQANADALISKLADPTVQQKLRDIRTRAQEIRGGYTSFTTAQKNRAVEDLADHINDISRIVLNILKQQRQDYSDPGD